ncbi:MAG: hypothetical protein WA981_00905 [Glaciecola sp.]
MKTHDRARIALRRAKGSHYSTMKQLADALGWSMTAVHRACEAEPEIRAILNANKHRPVKPLVTPRVKRDDVPMQPIIKRLHDAIQLSSMTQLEITERAGMSEAFFRDVFKRGHLPRMQSIMAVCEVLGYELQLCKGTS